MNRAGSTRAAAWLLIGLSVGIAAFVAALLLWKRGPAPIVDVADDPRWTWATPYRNVRPDVRYVGDDECFRCHAPIAKSFAMHAMGRSMSALAGDVERNPDGREPDNRFEKLGDRFEVLRRDGATIHRHERQDASGRTIVANEYEVAYAIGSGTRGKSYLFARDGSLFQSPISWFSEKRIWDLSPGFAERRQMTRPIIPECLFCHSNHADFVPDTVNRYRQPAFHGLSIGCERCHGPGRLHVERRTREEFTGMDDTIVHPGRLEPLLRDAICEQCHLQGEQRVTRRGRQVFDYRPGLPIHLFLSVCVRQPDLVESYRSVGQVEQMHVSKCYTSAEGKLGCISCHDPHFKPPETERVEYYRRRCQKCHSDCSVSEAARRASQPDNSCVDCHMAKAGSANIAHTAVTDHRILRRPQSGSPKPKRVLAPGEIPIRLFHAGQPGSTPAEEDRDLAVGMVQIASEHPQAIQQLAPLILPRLEAALARSPGDVDAWEARAQALHTAGMRAGALEALEKALVLAPNRETALALAARIAVDLQRYEEAIRFVQRAIDVNGSHPHYHVLKARALGQLGRWPEARDAGRLAVALDPFHTDARTLLVTALVRIGDEAEARREFAVLTALKPQNEAELRRWFEKQLRH